MKGALLAVAALALTGCGSRHSVSVRDISFASGRFTVEAFLVEPAGSRPRAGVVVVHGSGGDRRELLGDAKALARGGAAAIAITAPSSAHPPAPATSIADLLAKSEATQLADVAAVRRAADVLQRAGVSRLGYLGWSSGAKTGALVAAADRRFRALALLSAGADPVSAFAAAAPPAARPLVRRRLGPIDPIRTIARARPGTILLEDGTKDAVVPHRALLNVVRAAPPGTTVRWYAAGHALNAAAHRDAEAWLLRRLAR